MHSNVVLSTLDMKILEIAMDNKTDQFGKFLLYNSAMMKFKNKLMDDYQKSRNGIDVTGGSLRMQCDAGKRKHVRKAPRKV